MLKKINCFGKDQRYVVSFRTLEEDEYDYVTFYGNEEEAGVAELSRSSDNLEEIKEYAKEMIERHDIVSEIYDTEKDVFI